VTGRPQLRDDLVIVEQWYRGEQSFVVKDPKTHKYYRFKPLEVLVMQQFTGEHTAADLAAGLAEQDVPISARAIEGFAQKLRHMDLLVRSLAEKSVLQLERLRAERRRRVRGTHYRGSLLRLRWSVGDPDRLLDRWLPRLRFCFTRPFLVASVGLFVVYAAITASRLADIGHGVLAFYTADFYTLQNILLFWLVASTVIAIHELGHAFACKYFGGHVHELGAMLIYFQPAFYCNVNDAWTFPERSRRLWVTAAGTWIQLIVAGLAAIVWVIVDPESVVSRAAFFAVLIGGATTVLANANPLIPLDGYYALSDYLEIPNLRQRAFGHLGWLVRRYVLRLDVPQPPADDRERRVFLLYGLLSTAYITLVLTLFGALVFGWARRALGAIGVAAFALLLWSALRRPLREWGRAVATAARERARRLPPRTGRLTAVAAVLGLAVLLLVPCPVQVGGRFVTAPAAEAELGASEDDAIVDRVMVGEGARVAAGTPLVRLRHFDTERELVRASWRVDSVATLIRALRAQGRDPEAQRLEIARAEQAAARDGLRQRLDALTLRAPWHGIVVTPRPDELVGRRFGLGQTVLRTARLDVLEGRLEVRRGGALIRPGQVVTLIADADHRPIRRAAVRETAVAGAGTQTVTVRVALPGDQPGWPAGVTGRARVTIRRSNLLGALWWGLRKLVRTDLLL
jgi:putative peptide zinc metalloprotease protein